MDTAEKYKNRHRAVIEYANGAMFNLAELDKWAVANSIPVPFGKLFCEQGGADIANCYLSFEHLSSQIAWESVPENTDPDTARALLNAAHDHIESSDPVTRYRDLVEVGYNRELLSAVYDGDLNLYDTLRRTKVDVTAARLGYNENPDAFLQNARARIIARLPVAAQSVLNNAGTVLPDEVPISIMDGGEAFVLSADATATASHEGPPEARMPANSADLINEQGTYWARRRPAPLYAGTGYSEELLKQTALTKYLQYDTWTPAAAALLVSGLQAPIVDGQLCTEIPNRKVQGLDGLWKSDTFGAIADAKRVLAGC
jgi:hypothetical protein